MMTTDCIVESEMIFGPFREGICFYIEKSKCFQEAGQGVKIVEFVVLEGVNDAQSIRFYEAKRTAPKELDKYVEDLHEKFVNGLLIIISSILNRNSIGYQELSDEYRAINLNTIQIIFILIVKEHRNEWLAPLQDKFTNKMRGVLSSFGRRQCKIIVMNEEQAIKTRLISNQAA